MRARTVVALTAERLGLSVLVRMHRRLHAWRMSLRTNTSIFEDIYRTNAWLDPQSRSGTGSSHDATTAVRAALSPLLTDFGIRSILDAPCGDFNWMREVDLRGIPYTGIDVVPAIIAANSRYAAPDRTFKTLDLINDTLPAADLILCRDTLVHFPYRDIFLALKNFKASGACFLLTTTYPGHSNRDVPIMSYWRPLDLQAAPFCFSAPLRLVSEQCKETPYETKSLGLWRLADVPPHGPTLR